jgi:hypothetical protein
VGFRALDHQALEGRYNNALRPPSLKPAGDHHAAVAWQLAEAMKEKKISKNKMA